jgi:hypothetical protein
MGPQLQFFSSPMQVMAEAVRVSVFFSPLQDEEVPEGLDSGGVGEVDGGVVGEGLGLPPQSLSVVPFSYLWVQCAELLGSMVVTSQALRPCLLKISWAA